jgi:hypothetical protein
MVSSLTYQHSDHSGIGNAQLKLLYQLYVHTMPNSQIASFIDMIVGQC